MADTVDSITRSRMMSGIRSQNTKPELIVRSLLHGDGFRYRIHDRSLPGSPDLVFRSLKTVVFVHGCYWHRHSGCGLAYEPKSRVEFWEKKFSDNVRRDQAARSELRSQGWTVFVVWECQTRSGDLQWILDEMRKIRLRIDCDR